MLLIALLQSKQALATNHLIRMDEVMAGANGDPAIQYVEITVSGPDQKRWGPQSGEAASRAMLLFFDESGNQIGRFNFPSDPPVGGNTVLVATAAFAALPGAPVPDFVMPPLLKPINGKVCFVGNPANPFSFDVNLCLSYGNVPINLTDGGGPAAPALRLNGEPISLSRIQNFGFGSSRNADFALSNPSPLNTRGQTTLFPVDGPEIDHVPAVVNFGIQDVNAGPSSARTLTITNRGVINPLVITGLSLVGPNADQFSVTSDTGQTTLASGDRRNLVLRFDPTTPDLKRAFIRVINNDTNEGALEIPLEGLGVDPTAPEIEITPLAAHFGNQNISRIPTLSRTISIINRAAIGSLQIALVDLKGPDAGEFRIVSDSAQDELAPGETRSLTLVFDPSTTGIKRAVLRCVSNDTDEGDISVALEGNGFDLNPCVAPNPTNTFAQNLCVDAQLACPGEVFKASLAGATADGGSSCSSSLPDVWYRYVPGANGVLTVSVSDSGGALTISAHSGCPGNAGNQLACLAKAGQSPATNLQFTLNVTNKVEVLIRVAGPSAAGKEFTMLLAGPPCFDFDLNKNQITDSCEFDFGDAPAPYPSLLGADGPRHPAFSPLFLGTRIDPEPNGQPTPLALGDNFDGLPSDDDGVTFLTNLVPGQTATLEVVSSGNGFLNAWIDFNADRDWSDSGESILVNRAVVSGLNLVTFPVPATATPTNQTYARFRLNSTGNLGVTGAALDGEVEDYVVAIQPLQDNPSELDLRLNEVLAGAEGESEVQFVEILAQEGAAKQWGPQGNETVGRAMLVFFDEAGKQAGRFVFPSNAPAGGASVLVGTRRFAEVSGLVPDFIIPPEIVPIAGKVVFQDNPANSHFHILQALSYGGNRYAGLTDGAGMANTNKLEILHARSLGYVGSPQLGIVRNADFQLGLATPRNTRNQEFVFPQVDVAEQGRNLFMKETFRGNSRTCASCHVPGRDQFGLTPLTIASLPKQDPLFVFEENVNLVRLAAPSSPSDLRGPVRGSIGKGRILGGSGNLYFVIGGNDLAGTLTDTNGNQGEVIELVEGDLGGPNPVNQSPRGLEDHQHLTHGRGLILENIDGFQRLEVFRTSPHLLNVGETGPFGLSGEFATLEVFSRGAVLQHFGRSLKRRSGIDFREPTPQELSAMTAFMQTIRQPSNGDFNLDHYATTEAQQRGRTLFFGVEGRCSSCHSGPQLAFSDGSLTNSIAGVNENFDTGVANQAINGPDGDNLPTEPAGLPARKSTRKFNTPPLFGVRLTAPFFHDGSAGTLADAIRFYQTEEFVRSEAGTIIGPILAANKPAKVADLVSFLECLVELPLDFTRRLDFGVRCLDGALPAAQTVTISNRSSLSVQLSKVVLAGADQADFRILSDSGETLLTSQGVRRIMVAFNPSSRGLKSGILEVYGQETNSLGAFSFGTALEGRDLDNRASVDLAALDFGPQEVGGSLPPTKSVVVHNSGSTRLEIRSITVDGTHADQFILSGETNGIPANGSLTLRVAFTPKARGLKSGVLSIKSSACEGDNLQVALSGLGTAQVDHYEWSAVVSPQKVGVPMEVEIFARDKLGGLIDDFAGVVNLRVDAEPGNVGLVTPPASSSFVAGVWRGAVVLAEPASQLRLLAFDAQGRLGRSGAFSLDLTEDLSVSVVPPAQPVVPGELVKYSVIVSNTGPSIATNVVLTDTLPIGSRVSSVTVSHGQVLQTEGLVIWSIGEMAPERAALLEITIEAPFQTALIVNAVQVGREGKEFYLRNNRVVNESSVRAMGLLVLIEDSDLSFSGFTGGNFSPAKVGLVLSNAGSSALDWKLLTTNCVPAGGLVSSWSFEDSGTDSLGANDASIPSNMPFSDGIVSRGLNFDNGALGFHRESLSFSVPQATKRITVRFDDISPLSGSAVDVLIDDIRLSSAQGTGGSLVNGSFEDGLVGWEHDQNTFSIGDANLPIGFSGFSSGNLGTFDQRGSFLSQSLAVLPGDYVLSFWIGANGTRPGLTAAAQLRVSSDNGTTLGIGEASVVSLGSVGTEASVKVPASRSLDVGAGGNFTLAAWVRPRSIDGEQPLLEWHGGTAGTIGVHLWISVTGPGSIFGNLIDSVGSPHNISSAPGLLKPGVWQQVALTYDRQAGRAVLYLNGESVASEAIGQFTPRTSTDLFFGERAIANFPAIKYRGLMDEVAVYSRSLPAAEIRESFESISSSSCFEETWFVPSSTAGRLAPGHSARLEFSPTERARVLLPGSYLDQIVITNTSATRTGFVKDLRLDVINRTPTIADLPLLQLVEDMPTQTVAFSGVSAGGTEVQTLEVLAKSVNPELIPDPIEVIYTSPRSSGSLRFRPRPDAAGEATIKVTVRDSGGIIGGAQDSITKELLVRIMPVNDAPVLFPIPDQVVGSGESFGLKVTAEDVDTSPELLRYSVVDPVPVGMTMDPISAFIRWSTPLVDASVTERVTVAVRDVGSPLLETVRSFSITVVPRPAILSITAQQSVVLIEWRSQAGSTYQIFVSADPGDERWQPTGPEIVSVGSLTTAAIPFRVAESRFFRVVFLR